MELKLSPRMFDALTAQLRCPYRRDPPDREGDHDHRNPRRGHAAQGFIGTFPKNETSGRWIARHIKAARNTPRALAR